MSESQSGTDAQAPAEGPGTLQAWIAALRSDGAAQLDPARFHYLETLSRRMQGQQAAVQRLLQERLHAAVAAYAERFAQSQRDAASEADRLLASHPALGGALRRLQVTGDVRGMRRLAARVAPGPASSPLARLNEYLRAATAAGNGVAAAGENREQEELASVRRFRRVWDSCRTHDQVERAASRRPANAGPLNSHALVLQSLALMGELSTDYLRHFLLHVESLQWLEQAGEKLPRPKAKKAGKPARRSTPKK